MQRDIDTAYGELPPGYECVWSPIPNSSQEIAINTHCDITLYEGARGPGKTVTQLMRYRRNVGIGYGIFWRGIIFDREFDNLSGLVAEAKKWFPRFDDGARFLKSASEYKWVWPTGEELLFRHVKDDDDYLGFHGHEYPFIGWNELTKYPTSNLFDKMMSVNRSSFTPERDTPKDAAGNYLTWDGKPLPRIPLEVFATTNSEGPGHHWVKRRFIDCGPRGVVIERRIDVFNPQTQRDETVIKTQITIFGSWRENIYLDPAYIAELESITDENLRQSWLFGNWNVVSGGALDDVWKPETHILPRFVIPSSWKLDRSFDWGSSHPFSVGWWAETNGEEATIHFGGEVFSFAPPAGTLIQFYEWYGTKEIGTNKGLKMSAGDIAEQIKQREVTLKANGWIAPNAVVYGGPADNQISDVREADVETIEDKMLAKGVGWSRSDKSPGSRKIGLELIRGRLQSAARAEGPGLYFMANCIASTSILPTLPRDKDKIDDVDTDAEDHSYDMVRYRCLKSNNRSTTRLNIGLPT